MADLLLSLAMLGAVILLGGAYLVLRRGDKKHALLMVIAALVVFANVAIWMVPLPAGG